MIPEDDKIRRPNSDGGKKGDIQAPKRPKPTRASPGGQGRLWAVQEIDLTSLKLVLPLAQAERASFWAGEGRAGMRRYSTHL